MIVKCEEEVVYYITMDDGTEYIRMGDDCWKERMNGFDYEIWNLDRLAELEKSFQNYKNNSLDT